MALSVEGVCPLLEVFDMPASLRFYRDTLGFEIVAASAPGDDCDWVWLRLDDADLMLNTAYEAGSRPSEPDPARIAAHHDTALFFGCPDLDAACTFLRDQGLPVNEPESTHYGMRQLYLLDPDGYNLCFQRRA